VELVVGDEDIHPAVEIVIGDAGAHAFAEMGADAGFGGDIPEGSVAVVQEELVRGGLVELGMAVIELAGRGFAGRLGVDVPGEVVDHEEVEEAVVVDIHPGSGDRPQGTVLGIGLVEAGLVCHVLEGAVALVVVEPVAVHAGDEDVLEAVVVVVADGDAVVEAGAGEACAFGDVFEVAVAVILEKAVGVFRGGLLQRPDVGAVGEEDVGMAVVVVVEDGHASGHGLRRVALGGLGAIEAEVDGAVGEVDGRWGVLARESGPERAEQGRGEQSVSHGFTVRSGGCGCSSPSSLTFANSASASSVRPRERSRRPRR